MPIKHLSWGRSSPHMRRLAGPVVTPALDEYNKLLLHFDTLPFTDDLLHTVTNTDTNLACSPKFGTAMGYFKSSGDIITTPDSDDFNLGSVDWTFDMWVWFHALANSSVHMLFKQYQDGASYFFVYLSVTSTGEKRLTIENHGTPLFTSYKVATINIQTWYHLAFVRNGTTITFYVNGASIGTYDISTNAFQNFAGTFDITDNGYFLNGCMDEFRFSKGIARWTSNFTPPTEAYAVDAYTKLLLHFDGSDNGTTFTDECGHTFTRGGSAYTKTAIKKFGGSSACFNGSSSFVYVADSDDWYFGSGDFTIDLWARWSTLSNSCFMQQSNSTGGYVLKWCLLYDNTNHVLKVTGHNPAPTPLDWISASFTPVVNTWYHLAFVRNGNTFKIYVNGICIGTTTTAVDLPQCSSLLYIGQFHDMPILGGLCHTGELEEIRISKGIARWTADFTPPTVAYS